MRCEGFFFEKNPMYRWVTFIQNKGLGDFDMT